MIMRQPGDLSTIVPPDEGDVYRRLREMQRQIDELRGELARLRAGLPPLD